MIGKAIIVVLLATSTMAGSNPLGRLDPTFGVGGKVTTKVGAGSAASAIVIQPDGKLVVGGWASRSTPVAYDWTIVRYNRNGSLDRHFARGGKFRAELPGGFGVQDLALQRDGKIVAVGWARSDDDFVFAVIRINRHGRLDPSFGDGGRVLTAIPSAGGSGAFATAAGIQGNRKIVVGGRSKSGFVVTRYDPDGSLDASFGTGGISTTSFGFSAALNDLAIQRDGKIVAVGTGSPHEIEMWLLARYRSNGSLDSSFGDGGKVKGPQITLGSAGAEGVAVSRNRRIVVGGGFGSGFTVGRYKSNGMPDTSFGEGDPAPGFTSTRILDFAQIHSVTLQRDGRILGGGEASRGDRSWFALARYTHAGQTDTSFGRSGVVTTAVGGRKAAATSIRFQGPKLVAVGNTGLDISAGTGRMGIARYLVTH